MTTPGTEHRRRRSARVADESGLALVSVIGLGFVMTLLVTASLAHALGGMRDAARQEDWIAALHAAEAGTDDYLFRINNADDYWQYDASNPPPDGNEAFSSPQPVPGAANHATFTYDVDASTVRVDGIVTVTATGHHSGEERTVTTRLRRRGFLDYLYFTQYETRDPALYPTSGSRNRAWAEAHCNAYWYAGRHADCTRIYFGGNDVIRGPLHTNDTIWLLRDPQFLGPTSSSWSIPTSDDCSHERWRGHPSYSNAPEFPTPCSPTYAAPLDLPPSNAAIKLETRGDLGNTGCLFTGPTLLEFADQGGVPRMRVLSPLSAATNCGADVTGVSWNDLPDNGVVYVQNAPTDAADPNHSTHCSAKRAKHPLDDHLTPRNDTTYGCGDGDVFTWGEMGGALTVAAENDILLVDDLVYVDPVEDAVLGLVANNYVKVYHPVDGGKDLEEYFTTPEGRKLGDLEVHAAIVSVEHSFTVENYNRGRDLGVLTVRGAIAQKFRGPVGTTGGTGYDKDYNYDERLGYTTPPHFIDAVSAAWKVIDWAE